MSIGLMYIYYYISQIDIKNNKNNKTQKPYNRIKQNMN